MNILYIGDIMGSPGRKAVETVLPKLYKGLKLDCVIAQSENVTHGKAMSTHHYNELLGFGVHAFTGGNHSFERPDTATLMQDSAVPVVGPANVKGPTYLQYKTIHTNGYTVVFASLLGYTIPHGYGVETVNPLLCSDELLAHIAQHDYDAILLNIHSDISSEKVMTGFYLDGIVTAVIGDHWHIPTADARILPSGTAYITDVGMCGSLNSSLGVQKDIAINRWRGKSLRNKMDNGEDGLQFNAVYVQTDDITKRPTSIEHIQRYI